jgi:3' terminal RNA ribose 2'-O-methyltransferase Hen1
MLLTITTTHQPATDLGFLLHKNPARAQSYELPFGRVHVFYPESSAQRCTAALLVEVDPIGLSRRRGERSGEGQPLEPYVNDRPYAATSFLSVALTRAFRSALAGTSKDRPELVDAAIPLEATIACVPCRGGETLLRRLFEPVLRHLPRRRVRHAPPPAARAYSEARRPPRLCSPTAPHQPRLEIRSERPHASIGSGEHAIAPGWMSLRVHFVAAAMA